MSPYFSKTVIRKLEPIILDHLAKLLGRFESAQKSGEVLELGIVYRALTSDIITQYSFGKSTNFLDLPDFNAPFYHAVLAVFECVPLLHHISWLGPLMNSLPTEIVLKLMPGLGSVHMLQKVIMEARTLFSFLLTIACSNGNAKLRTLWSQKTSSLATIQFSMDCLRATSLPQKNLLTECCRKPSFSS